MPLAEWGGAEVFWPDVFSLNGRYYSPKQNGEPNGVLNSAWAPPLSDRSVSDRFGGIAKTASLKPASQAARRPDIMKSR